MRQLSKWFTDIGLVLTTLLISSLFFVFIAMSFLVALSDTIRPGDFFDTWFYISLLIPLSLITYWLYNKQSALFWINFLAISLILVALSSFLLINPLNSCLTNFSILSRNDYFNNLGKFLNQKPGVDFTQIKIDFGSLLSSRKIFDRHVYISIAPSDNHAKKMFFITNFCGRSFVQRDHDFLK